ncbi:MAG TPA: hypothetical protein VIL35_17665 [Vicinamibacterales bacterium]
MTLRRFGFAAFALALAVYVPACEVDPTTGAPMTTVERLNAPGSQPAHG